MAGILTHSPADIIRYLLIAKGLGVLPPGTNANWPIYSSNTPDLPDRIVSILDMGGAQHGRVHTDGEMQEHEGFIVIVRSLTHQEGYPKARAIAIAMDEDVYDDYVVIDGVTYLVHAVMRTGDVTTGGTESPDTQRYLFRIDAVVSVRQR